MFAFLVSDFGGERSSTTATATEDRMGWCWNVGGGRVVWMGCFKAGPGADGEMISEGCMKGLMRCLDSLTMRSLAEKGRSPRVWPVPSWPVMLFLPREIRIFGSRAPRATGMMDRRPLRQMLGRCWGMVQFAAVVDPLSLTLALFLET